MLTYTIDSLLRYGIPFENIFYLKNNGTEGSKRSLRPTLIVSDSRFFIPIADIESLVTADPAASSRLLGARTVVIEHLSTLSQQVGTEDRTGGTRSRPHSILCALYQATIS